MNYKNELKTNNKSIWINTRQYICFHHTATNYWSIKWVLNTLTKWNVSCHYVIDTNGDKYKIWSTDNILWHCWVSEWKGLKDMNKYSIWIEVIWPLPDVWFTREQRIALRELIEHLMYMFKIPKENVIRHADLTHNLSSKWILWDWKSKSRKVDIDKAIYLNGWFKTFKDYQDSLVPKEMIAS